jgi:hypothetical protein
MNRSNSALVSSGSNASALLHHSSGNRHHNNSSLPMQHNSGNNNIASASLVRSGSNNSVGKPSPSARAQAEQLLRYVLSFIFFSI